MERRQEKKKINKNKNSGRSYIRVRANSGERYIRLNIHVVFFTNIVKCCCVLKKILVLTLRHKRREMSVNTTSVK